MNFKREQIRDYYLLDTKVENIFINEYMASAPGDFVKVYLYSLMYADLGQEMSNEMIAKQLGLDEEDVLKAWTYWDGLGVINKQKKNPENKFDYQVEFVNLKELLYGKAPKKKPPLDENVKSAMADKDVQDMYHSIERLSGKILNGSEMMEIMSWLNDFNAAPEVIVYAYSYCMSKNKKNVKYVAAVVKQWVEAGLTDVVAVENYLKETDQKHYLYKRICKSLGFARNVTEGEKRIINRWFDEMDYTIDKVLEACGKTSGISNPNINYVNKILVNWYEEKTGMTADGKPKPVSTAEVMKYYDFIRKEAEEEADKRRQKAYETVPRIKAVEEEMNLCSMEISKMIISDRVNKKSEIEKLKNQIDRLNGEKAVLLTDNNFELDYMDVKYRCGICKDTGINDTGERCECFQQRTKEAETWHMTLAKSSEK